MTKNRSMKIAVLVLALALITACFVGTTFAKYTSEGTKDSTGVQVAQWKFTNFDVTNNSFDFDLFATINGYDTGDESQLATKDEEVATNRIAPGTSGAATLTITNDSEVDATLAFSLDVSDFTAITPLVFTYKIGGTEVENMDELAAIDLPMGETATVTVEWAWPYEGDHTSFGIDAINDGDVNMVATATVTLTQVN